jgi:hypothetical protein
MTVRVHRMNEYLASLPRGLDSYPEYVVKAAALREFLPEVSEAELVALGLPTPLVEIVRTPPPVTHWLPEVHAVAISLAIADGFFASEEAYLSKKLQANRRLLSGPLYRFLFLFVSPREMLTKHFVDRWEKFHRGLLVKSSEVTDGTAKVQLRFPHHLVPRLQADTYGVVLQAAVEAAGGKQAAARIEAFGSTFADYDVRWR